MSFCTTWSCSSSAMLLSSCFRRALAEWSEQIAVPRWSHGCRRVAARVLLGHFDRLWWCGAVIRDGHSRERWKYPSGLRLTAHWPYHRRCVWSSWAWRTHLEWSATLSLASCTTAAQTRCDWTKCIDRNTYICLSDATMATRNMPTECERKSTQG